LIPSWARTGNGAGPFVILLAVLSGVGLLACARVPAADSERVALEAAIQRWTTAVNAQDLATLNSTMTEDVELLGTAATVTGREAAIRALRAVATRGTLVATTREIKIANDVAWRIVGVAQARKNGDVHALGQALEIWKRVQGEWKLHRQLTSGVAPGDLLTRPSTNEPVLDRGND
jgi:ketosteroid isomerase-like protein